MLSESLVKYNCLSSLAALTFGSNAEKLLLLPELEGFLM